MYKLFLGRDTAPERIRALAIIHTSAIRDIVGKYERNEMKPSIETARRLANALNVTLDYLVGDSDTTVFDKDITKRIEDIIDMGSEDKNALFKIIDAYIRDFKAKKAYS
ncbi:helix-turn-helix transcriptional regulator [uncultured Aquimarina sp.]|uniref:helix-turn-helix domain-containing protein n=1 Tax=uncultured Aquimarina sp. TaxID=575652 RepID=UPI00260DCFEC|nr:helix-turn-helix transcriptional regulator [uncultured Aquimarina sp.]